MADQEEGTPEVPPTSGPRHPLPVASLWPFGFAAGIALILVGVVISWPVFAIGCGLAAVFGLAWAYDAVRGGKPAALPAEEPEAEDAEEEAERFGRDAFLERTTLGLGAIIGVAVTVPIVGFMVVPAFVDQGDEDIDLGPLSNYPEGQFLVVTFRSREGEGDVSTRTAFVRNNGFLNDVPSFTIISNRCAHLGCPTQPGGPTETEAATEVETDSGVVRLIPSQPAGGFICPCHGGAYDTEGNRTAGPPVRGLDRYLYSIVNGNLVLGLRYSVGEVEGTGAEAKIVGYTRYDPGQHVDGPTDWLYPISPHEIYD